MAEFRDALYIATSGGGPLLVQVRTLHKEDVTPRELWGCGEEPYLAAARAETGRLAQCVRSRTCTPDLAPVVARLESVRVAFDGALRFRDFRKALEGPAAGAGRRGGRIDLGGRALRMLLPDVNVLIYAHREDSTPEHPAYARWIRDLATGIEPFALSALGLAGLVRIVTNPRIFRRPSTLDEAFGFLGELTARPNARVVTPGTDHLKIFEDLCRKSGAKRKLAAGAQHAAVAIEHGCTFVTTDSDFDRFPGLRWRHPLRS